MIPPPFISCEGGPLYRSPDLRSKPGGSAKALPLLARLPGRSVAPTAVALLIVLLQPCRLFAHQPTSKPDAWREDLRALSISLPQLHKNLFFQMSSAAFDDAVAQLDGDIPTLSDEQIILRMAGIVAMAGDAHTSLSLTSTQVPFRTYPIRLQWFSDGIFVIRASPEYRHALGYRLIQIGENAIQQVCEEVGKLISHENEPWKKSVSQNYLVIPEVLHGLGLLRDEEEARFIFQKDTGERIVLDLKPISRNQAVDWISPFDSNTIPRPLYLKNPGSGFSYWAEYLSDSRTLFLKYYSCRSDAGLPFEYMTNILLAYLDTGLVKRFIIELRENTGGNSEVIKPLINGLKQRAARGLINPSSDIWAMIGRQTFSSGMLGAINFREISARLIGEPTGGKPNSYGEVKTFTLPRSGLAVSYSTKYFQFSPVDTPSVTPDLEVTLSSKDYFQGRDPVLDAILGVEQSSTSAAGFVLYQNGALSHTTVGTSSSVTAGYGMIGSAMEAPAPAGLAILTVRKDGITVGEASVPASIPLLRGRIYVESQDSIRTGIAFANPNSGPAAINFYFTDSAGRDYKHGSIVIPAKERVARFLDQEPFSGAASFVGTFSWASTIPIGAAAFRETLGEHKELLTSLPVSDLTAQTNQRQVLAHFADGAGWTTQVVLVNPTDNPLKGSLHFFGQGSEGQAAQPIEVAMDGGKGSTFSYDLPPRSSRRFATAGLQRGVRVGSVWIVPASESAAPSAFGIFTFKSGEEITSTAGAPALVPRQTFQIYAQASGNLKGGDFGSAMSGIAICNPTEESVTVNLTLRYLSGINAKPTASVTIPARGQTAMFLSQIPGFDSLQTPFGGMLEVSTSRGSIAVVGLRVRFNERGGFLMAATPPIDEKDESRERLFAHLADGGGYATQLILISTAPGQNPTGAVQFFNQSGAPWSLTLR